MDFLEKDLEDLICNTSNELLESRGLPIMGKKYRQFNLGAYGIADVVTIHRSQKTEYCGGYHFEIFELKKGSIDHNALGQVLRYARAIQRFFKNRGIDHFTMECTLIGRSIELGDLVYLTDLIETEFNGLVSRINYYTYEYNFDGVHFQKREGWFKSGEEFK